MNQTSSARDRSLFYEILRFAIIGVYGTLIDFAIEGWATSMVADLTKDLGHIASFFVMFLLSILGFLVATPATWSLSSVWGFRNVSEDASREARSLRGSLVFAFWSFLGLLIGAIIQFFGYMICLEWSGWGINILGGFSFDAMFGAGGKIDVFYAWGAVLVIRTAVTMVWNYLTRKLFIYKAPKEEGPTA